MHGLPQQLTRGQFIAFNGLLLELHAVTNEKSLPEVIITGLGELFTASFIVCRMAATADRATHGSRSVADRWGLLESAYEAVRHDDPLVNRRRDVPSDAALAISDFISPDAWRTSPFYRAFCRPAGIEDQLSIECSAGPRALHVVISRNDYGGFTPVDRWLLDQLRPHLVQVCRVQAVLQVSDVAEVVEGVLSARAIIFDDMAWTVSCTEATRLLVEKLP